MIRWITEQLGTSAWHKELALENARTVDVRLLRDGRGNSLDLIRQKIEEALAFLRDGKRVVICCDHGVSRSNAIAAAVIATQSGGKLNQALLQVIQVIGETGIKIDFVADVRAAINESKTSGDGTTTYILGRNSLVGQTAVRLLDTSRAIDGMTDELALVNNPVLLEALLDDCSAGRILFCWRPDPIDTNEGIGKLIKALRNVLEVCRLRNTELIFISGYQVFSGLPSERLRLCAEELPPMPDGAVGDGLFLAEQLVNQYVLRCQLSALVVRPSLIYGMGDDRPGIVNTFIRKALANDEIVTHRFKNGLPLVDLLHVTDFVNAIALAIEKKLVGKLHVASGQLLSTNELARQIVKSAASDSRVSIVEMPGNRNSAHLDASRAGIALDWRPTVKLSDGLSELLAHFTLEPLYK